MYVRDPLLAYVDETVLVYVKIIYYFATQTRLEKSKYQIRDPLGPSLSDKFPPLKWREFKRPFALKMPLKVLK